MKAKEFLVLFREIFGLAPKDFAYKIGISVEEYKKIESIPYKLTNLQFLKIEEAFRSICGEKKAKKVSIDFWKAIQFDVLNKHGCVLQEGDKPRLRLVGDESTDRNSEKSIYGARKA